MPKHGGLLFGARCMSGTWNISPSHRPNVNSLTDGHTLHRYEFWWLTSYWPPCTFQCDTELHATFFGGTAEGISDSIYCDRCIPCVVRLSVCMSVGLCRLSHSCTLLKLLEGMRCHLAGTFVWSQVTWYETGAPVAPTRRGNLGSKPPVRNCIANCGQTVTDSGMVTIDRLQELSNALSNGTIADPIRLPLLLNNMFAAMPPSATLL